MSSDETCRLCGEGRARRIKTSEILQMWSMLPSIEEIGAIERLLSEDADADDKRDVRMFIHRVDREEVMARKAALEGRPNSVQIQARIPEDIAKIMIDRALAEGRSLSSIVRELIEGGLQSRNG